MLGIHRELLEPAGTRRVSPRLLEDREHGYLAPSRGDGDLWKQWQDQGNAIAGLHAEVDEALREARDLLRELSEGDLPPGVDLTAVDGGAPVVENRASFMIPGR